MADHTSLKLQGLADRLSALRADLGGMMERFRAQREARLSMEPPQCHSRRWGARCVRSAGHAVKEHAGVLEGKLVTWVDEPPGIEVARD
ncbi:MAG TPA: hypothetical protein VK539_03210 [Myxococcaceae bacterium]|nr:hypothetical protein [Myxococcaceae bacterium]